MKMTVMKAISRIEQALKRPVSSRVVTLGLAGLLSVGCSSSGHPVEAGDEADETDASSDETTSHDEPSQSETLSTEVATSGADLDASIASTADFTSIHVDAAVATSTFVGAASSTTEPVVSDSDASVILEPGIETLTASELCERVEYLEGQTVDVDLHEQLSLTAWRELDLTALGNDSTTLATDTATDAGACSDGFAAYAVKCRGTSLIVMAPTLLFGEGPEIGGETVGFGCWQHGCDVECVPAAMDEVALVRGRVGAPINRYYDEKSGDFRGLLRLNGADFDAIGFLEVLSQP